MFGLVGKSLSHSISPLIHSQLGDPNYCIWETQDIEQFIKTKEFSGLNVTIPYKEEIIPFLDELDGIAKTIKSVNTVIKRDGKLIGYNTDYYGLFKTLQYHKINIKNQKVLIIGNGGASKTATLLMKNMGAQSINIVCRNPINEDENSLIEVAQFYDSNVIINTTPIGMYPHNDDELAFSLKGFTHLEFVLDLIYNPLRTRLMLEAQSLGAKVYNGLYMLVMQAKASRELFLNDANINHELPKKIYDSLNNNRHNLVLIGMPLSGKSAYAKNLAPIYQKSIVDTDNLIEMLENQSISDIFNNKGESYFRTLENKVVTDLYQSTNLIISTGGGMILDQDIMEKLKQNGIIIYLDKDYHQIMEKNIQNRPLINSKADVEKLALARKPFYEKHADILVKIDKEKQDVLLEIEAKLHDYFSR